MALVLLGLSLRSAVSAGGSDEEVFPPKTLEKLKKNYTSQQKKTKTDTAGQDNGTNQKSTAKESQETTSTKNKDAISSEDQNVSDRGDNTSNILEDEPLIADLTSIIDKDGIGEVNVVWKISNDGNV